MAAKSATTKLKRKVGNKKPAPKPRFWRMPPNPDMDRAGDFLLKNLSALRREGDTRADTP